MSASVATSDPSDNLYKKTLCISVDRGFGKTFTKDLLEAIRPRLDNRAVTVKRCGWLKPGESGWVARISRTQRRTFVRVLGTGVDVDRKVSERRGETIQSITALLIVEAVRPQIDAHLAAMGLSNQDVEKVSDSSDSALDTLTEGQTETYDLDSSQPIVKKSAKSTPSRWNLGTEIGARVGLNENEWAPHAAIMAGLRFDQIRTVLAVDFALLQQHENTLARADGYDIGVTASAHLPIRALEAGIAIGARVTHLSTDFGPELARSGSENALNWGIGTQLHYWIPVGKSLQLGAFAHSMLWLRPKDFVVEGNRLFRQDRVEILAGLSVLYP